MNTVGELRDAIGELSTGEQVRLGVERENGHHQIRVGTASLPDLGQAVGIGIVGHTRGLRVDLPINVRFSQRVEAAGPSAGLVYALAIADILSPTDYASGRTVAATGTIDLDGAVGPVGAVVEKAEGAQDADAAIFLVPAGEAGEAAAAVPDDLDVTGVRKLSSALRMLETL